MPRAELQARTAVIPKRTAPDGAAGSMATGVTTPVDLATTTTATTAPKQSLKGLDLAAIAAPAPPTSTMTVPAIPDAALGAVPGAVAAVTSAGDGFGALREGIDGIGDIAARQRAFLRVLETFASQWVPDATNRAMWNGTLGIVSELKKRSLWLPFERDPKSAVPKAQLDPAQQERFIDEVLTPSFAKLKEDTAALATSTPAELPANLRGLAELEQLWQPLAKGFWSAKQSALTVSDDELVSACTAAPAKEGLAAAATLPVERKAAADRAADAIMPRAGVDDVAALLFAAESGGPLARAKEMVGSRLTADHPAEVWSAWIGAGDPADVKTWVTRLHGMSLAVRHLPDGPARLWDAWAKQVSRFDVDDVETAAKLMGIARSLGPQFRPPDSYSWAQSTCALFPAVTTLKLCHLPMVPIPPSKGGGLHSWAHRPVKLPDDPNRDIVSDARSFLNDKPAALDAMLRANTPAAETRESIKLLIGTVDQLYAKKSEPLAASAAVAFDRLLADPATVDAGATRPPPEDSLQAVLGAANTLAAKLSCPIPLAASTLAPHLAARSSAELAALLGPATTTRGASVKNGASAWIGADAARAVRGELRARLDTGALEPHEQLLHLALEDDAGALPPFSSCAATVAAWIDAQRAKGADEHAAALIAVAQTFGATSTTIARATAPTGATTSARGTPSTAGAATNAPGTTSTGATANARGTPSMAGAATNGPGTSTGAATNAPGTTSTGAATNAPGTTSTGAATNAPTSAPGPTSTGATTSAGNDVAALLTRSFTAIAAPRDQAGLERAFGLAKALEDACRVLGATLTEHVARTSPLELVSAPYASAATASKVRSSSTRVDDACRARIAALDVGEARAFFDGARDASTLLERVAIASRAWCALDDVNATPIANNTPAIVREALGPALARLARVGDAAHEDTRAAVLFSGSAAHKKLSIDIDIDTGAALPFARAASTRDLLALSLDDDARAGVKSAAAQALEERVAIGSTSALHDVLEQWSALTSSFGGASTKNGTATLAEWTHDTASQLATLDGPPWRAIWSALDKASARIGALPLAARVDEVVALFPPSRDRAVALSRALRGERAIPFAVLDKIDGYALKNNARTVLRADRRVLGGAMLTYPDGPFALIGALDGRARTSVPPALVETWRGLDAEARADVVGDAFRRLFEAAYGTSYGSGGDAAVRTKLDEAMEREVFAPLRSDSALVKLVDRLRPIFAALPRTVQARVAAAFALDPPDAKDAPAVLRRLLENAGVVAIKVAQQICEDPDVPARFRDVLESLRDQNIEVDALGVRAQTENYHYLLEKAAAGGRGSLGKRLGTGSVKQANRVVDDAGTLAPHVLAFVKPGAKEEIDESLRALAVDPELQPVVGRVRAMLVRELDLEMEARAFSTMATHLAPWPFLRVPKVTGSSSTALVREMSPGMPVSELLRERALDGAEKTALTDAYRALVQAAIDPARFVHGEGFVLTDPHQGNVAVDKTSAGVAVDLFDPGQYEKLGADEAALFVRLVVKLSKGSSFWAPKRANLIDTFASVIEKRLKGSYQPPTHDAIKAKLTAAWDDAEKTRGNDASPGAFLRAWLFAAADAGAPIPDAYFGVAKMLHTIDSQCRDMALTDVITEEVTRLFKAQLSFRKIVTGGT